MSVLCRYWQAAALRSEDHCKNLERQMIHLAPTTRSGATQRAIWRSKIARSAQKGNFGSGGEKIIKSKKVFRKNQKLGVTSGQNCQIDLQKTTQNKFEKTWNFHKKTISKKLAIIKKNRNWENSTVSKHLESIKKCRKFSQKVKIETFLKSGFFWKCRLFWKSRLFRKVDLFLILSTFFDT